jgi:hypothetical protein
VGHHVVTDAPLLSRSFLEVDVINGGSHRFDLLLGDREAELTLCVGQLRPE